MEGGDCSRPLHVEEGWKTGGDSSPPKDKEKPPSSSEGDDEDERMGATKPPSLESKSKGGGARSRKIAGPRLSKSAYKAPGSGEGSIKEPSLKRQRRERGRVTLPVTRGDKIWPKILQVELLGSAWEEEYFSGTEKEDHAPGLEAAWLGLWTHGLSLHDLVMEGADLVQ